MKSPNESSKLPNSFSACRSSEAFLAALADLYIRADDELSAVGAACKGGGACCKFDLADHRLFVSVGELALLSAEAPPSPERAARRRCPWQAGPRCTAHGRRPLGCRTYFCDRPTVDACREIYEQYHEAIRGLHDAHSLAYRYVELTGACEELYRRGDQFFDK